MAPRDLIRRAGLLALGLMLAAPALAQSAPQVVGAASAVVREAKLSNARAPKPHQVAVRERVALADQIQTGKQSQLQLLLLDRSVFSIGANARLTIDRFVYDPARGRSVGATAAKGAFRFMSGRPNAMGGSSIGTPVATIGIRGTIVEGVIGQTAIDIVKGETIRAAAKGADKDNATLVVLRGPGAAAQGDAQPGAVSVTSTGGTLDLTAPMQAAFVPRAAPARTSRSTATPSSSSSAATPPTPCAAPSAASGASAAPRSSAKRSKICYRLRWAGARIRWQRFLLWP